MRRPSSSSERLVDGVVCYGNRFQLCDSFLLWFRTRRNCAMTVDGFQIRKATPSDLAEILALLRGSSLPPDGVAEHLSEFHVVRDSIDRLVACAGVERYGAIGLLRSVAVSAELQRSGLGSRLVSRVLEEAG